MSDNYLILKSQQLAQQIKEAEAQGKSVDTLIQQQISVLEANYNEFVKNADEENIHNLERAQAEIEMLANIKAWAKKINLSCEKYDEAIKNIRVKMLGEINTNRFFYK